MLKYIDFQCSSQNSDVYAGFNRTLARLCREMLLQDADGRWILHYLGGAFRDAVTKGQHEQLFNQAKDFASEQFGSHHAEQNTKLAFRYLYLLQYLNAHEPSAGPSPAA